MKTWFVVLWGPDDCAINGPFGDDREAAVEWGRRELREDDAPNEAGAVFQLDIEEFT